MSFCDIGVLKHSSRLVGDSVRRDVQGFGVVRKELGHALINGILMFFGDEFGLFLSKPGTNDMAFVQGCR